MWLTENDGHENDGASKLQDMKLMDQVAGHVFCSLPVLTDPTAW